MKKHSIPQNIMEVEFKLFGAFSVRQFGYLATGFMLAAGIYFLNWPSIVKLIIIPLIGGLGLILALVKINGQSSSVWILHFVHALLNSQNRVWKKTSKIPDVLKETKNFDEIDIDRHINARAKKKLPEVNVIPLKNLHMSQPMNSNNTGDNKVDKYEQIRLREIEKYYNFEINKTNKISSTNIKRNVKLPTMKPTIQQTFNPVNTQVTTGLAQNVNITPQNIVINNDGYKASVRSVADMKNGNGNEINNLQNGDIRITKIKKDIANLQTQIGNSDLKSKPKIATMRTRVNVNIPHLSENANIIRGIVKNKTDKIISNAVINIVDNTNQLIRRILSDNQGKFILKNPLPFQFKSK